MEHRKLGNTDIQISAVTFGAWAIGGWLWGHHDDAQSIEAIHTALNHGVNTFDTAPIYGFGLSEKLIGKALGKQRDKCIIMTKFGLRWDYTGPEKPRYFRTVDNEGHPAEVFKHASADSIIKECEQSLKHLGTDYIDLYQIHWPDAQTPISESFAAVEKLLTQGKIRAAGVCNYSVDQINEAQKTVELASLQTPFSMVNRATADDQIPWCKEHNLGVVVYSPLQRGLLTGKIKPGHKFEHGDHRKENQFFTPGNIEKADALLEQIRPIAENHGATLAQIVINWTINQPGITSALVGARTTKQARENAQAVNFKLSQNELNTISEFVNQTNLEIADDH